MVTERAAISAPQIFTGERLIDGHAVLVDGDRVRAVVPISDVPNDYPRREAGGQILAPGFVEIHAHGAMGRSFNESDPDGHRLVLAAMLNSGVTTVLPTLSSAPLDEMISAVRTFAAGYGGGVGPRTPGLHLEGPYFSYEQKGAQDPAALRKPGDGSLDRLLEHAEVIRMVSFAPELAGAIAMTERLVEREIVAAAGHTNGTDADLAACQDAGLSHVIHVVSGQSTTTRRGPWRRPGMLEATLASDGLTVEVICDGKHLPSTLVRMVHRCLGGRLCMVSDSTPGAGLPEGTHYRVGSKEGVVRDGVGMTLDETSFAGSTTLLGSMPAIAVRDAGLSVVEALRMATSVPARAARIPDAGRIDSDCPADFVVLDDSLRVTRVALAGAWQMQGGPQV